jgi:hypothetical protein
VIPDPDISTPMLDVHAPHESIHTWRGFFIHIAAIVIGLLIAISLEPMVEFLHHREQRHQLLEDLRREAEEPVHILPINNGYHVGLEKWFRDVLGAARAASPIAGSITFVVPPKPAPGRDEKPETAVWAAAKASGAVSVLSRPEIETWERVDYVAQLAQKNAEGTQAADRALNATCDHIGASLEPGATVHLTLEQRDELTRSLATLIESGHALIVDDVLSLGASNGVLHGAQTWEQLEPFIAEAFKSMPQSRGNSVRL